MNAEAMARELGGDTVFERRDDGLWLDMPESSVPHMAQMMRDAEARLVTMTAKPGEATGSFELMYHWDISGVLLTVKVVIERTAKSIVDLWPAADWAERETRDYYAIEFEGRDQTPPLMLREGDRPGLFSATCDARRDADPAYTAKTGETTR